MFLYFFSIQRVNHSVNCENHVARLNSLYNRFFLAATQSNWSRQNLEGCKNKQELIYKSDKFLLWTQHLVLKEFHPDMSAVKEDYEYTIVNNNTEPVKTNFITQARLLRMFKKLKDSCFKEMENTPPLKTGETDMRTGEQVHAINTLENTHLFREKWGFQGYKLFSPFWPNKIRLLVLARTASSGRF